MTFRINFTILAHVDFLYCRSKDWEMGNDDNKIVEHKHLTARVNSTISSEQWLEMPRLRRPYN